LSEEELGDTYTTSLAREQAENPIAGHAFLPARALLGSPSVKPTDSEGNMDGSKGAFYQANIDE
jgi:hypothetical protein